MISDYGAIGPRYSNLVLQALLVLLKKEPPKVRETIQEHSSGMKCIVWYIVWYVLWM